MIRIDGGICSQMIQYAFGQLLRNKLKQNHINAKVKYDLSWFTDDGWDLLHKDKRNFDLKKLFPTLNLNIASNVEVKVYKKFYSTEIRDPEILSKMNPPICLNNYYDFPSDCYVETLRNIFTFNNVSLDEANTRILNEIKKCSNSCGVHVRRGDLANKEIAIQSGYINGVCEIDYFLNAINILKKIYKNIRFFFFSDDIYYVKNEILSKLNDIDCFIVDINSAEDGYKDLFLISNCNHQIASVGSLGVFANILNNYEEKILITNKEFYYNISKKAYLLNNQGIIMKNKM